jgi:hypothetical protein
MCAYCLEWLDRIYVKQQGRRVLNVAKSYDQWGHQLTEWFPERPPTKAALKRLFLMDQMIKKRI